MDFEKFQKIPRLSRDIIISEKIDGTNAQVVILSEQEAEVNEVDKTLIISSFEDMHILAGSRNRYLTTDNDNNGFATWVKQHTEELAIGLGYGRHYGEWWGQGIQRKYGLTEKRFSLFNTDRWGEVRPECCHVVPVLYEGMFTTDAVEAALERLNDNGSYAAPGFLNPEGVVIFHIAGNLMFKKTLDKDEVPKGSKEES